MKPQALLAGFALLLTACGGPENRSVSEELPLEEVNALLKKNPDYQYAVTLAERFRATASTVEKARANDLTYEALQTFLDSLSDSGVRDRLREQADAEWEERYGETAQRIPGLIAHWRHFLDSLRPESYVSVRLLSIDPRESTYGTARVVLEIAPTKGPIDRIEGRFGLFLRDRAHGFDDFSAARHNNFEFKRGLRAPTRITTWMQYSIWDIQDGDIAYNMFPDRPGLPIRELVEKYWFDYSVSELVIDGNRVNYFELYQQVPASIRDYWREDEEERRNREETLYGDIARELLDPDFVERTRFERKYGEDHFRERDSLAAWLVFDHNL